VKRRNVITSLVSATATLSGLGWGWWHFKESQRTPPPLDALWWKTRFERPDGGFVIPAEFKGQLLLLNFWATWCPPCVAELPMLDAFARERAADGWQVVGLALDNLAAVQQFLKRIPIGFPIGIAGLEALDLSRELGNHGGQLPFTAIWGRDGQLLQVKLGPVTEVDLTFWSTMK
jgi:thiol-disulfide isomerase/thioredoxin